MTHSNIDSLRLDIENVTFYCSTILKPDTLNRTLFIMNRRYQKVSHEDKLRILDCYRSGGSLVQLANALGINIKTVRSIARKDSSPVSKRGGSKKKVGTSDRQMLSVIVDENPAFTLKQIQERFQQVTGNQVSVATIDRYLDGHGYSLKILSKQPIDRNRADVKESRTHWANWLRSDGVQTARYYVDETNFNIWCSRSKGRSRVGTAASVSLPSSKGANINVIACMSNTGLLYFEFLPKVTHVQFNQFLEQCSDMINENTACFIFDNAPAHRRAEEASLQTHHSIRRLPPYSPMFNPIEELFSKFKSAIKRQLQERREEIATIPQGITMKDHRHRILLECARSSFVSITPTDCGNWDRHMFSFVDIALQGGNM